MLLLCSILIAATVALLYYYRYYCCYFAVFFVLLGCLWYPVVKCWCCVKSERGGGGGLFTHTLPGTPLFLFVFVLFLLMVVFVLFLFCTHFAQVNVIRDGKLFTLESTDICRGDLIKIEGGDLVSFFFFFLLFSLFSFSSRDSLRVWFFYFHIDTPGIYIFGYVSCGFLFTTNCVSVDVLRATIEDFVSLWEESIIPVRHVLVSWVAIIIRWQQYNSTELNRSVNDQMTRDSWAEVDFCTARLEYAVSTVFENRKMKMIVFLPILVFASVTRRQENGAWIRVV